MKARSLLRGPSWVCSLESPSQPLTLFPIPGVLRGKVTHKMKCGFTCRSYYFRESGLRDYLQLFQSGSLKKIEGKLKLIKRIII